MTPVYILAGQSNGSVLRKSGAFETAIVNAGGVPVMFTRGGTTIAPIDPDVSASLQVGQLGLDWHPDSDGELFDGLMTAVAAGMAEIDDPVIQGVLWVQGEGDAQDAGMAAAYEANLAYLIECFQAEWGPVPFVVAELASEAMHPYAGEVRAAQYAVDAIVIDTDDLQFKADGRHYTDEAAAVVAQRFLDALDGNGIEQAQDALIYGTGGNDSLDGTAGSDLLDGRAGDDWILGGSGNDTIKGRDGVDRIDGDDGDDWIMGGLGRDIIRGGNGVDTISYADLAHGIEVDLDAGWSFSANGDRIATIENVQGSSFDDILSGCWGMNELYGGAGDDTLYGGESADRLYGGAGADTFLFSPGQDKVFDYEVGIDRIGAAFEDVTISDHNGWALLELDGERMMLVGVAFDALSSDDFLA